MMQASVWSSTARLVRRSTAAAIVATGLASGNLAHADGAQDKALARALFDEARKLASDGRHAEACPKFEESQKLEPGIGTQFNLADCLEHIGKTASAWAMFLEVAADTRLKEQGQRESVARERAAALEPKLSRLTLTVPQSSEAEGLTIEIDGTPLGRAAWGTATPIDPGKHTVRAIAPGRRPWSKTIEVGGNGARAAATIPTLEPAGKESAPSVDREGPLQTASPSGRKTTGLVVGGVGVASLLVAGGFALRTRAKLNDAEAYCSGLDCWDQRGVDLHHEAVTSQTIALVATGRGVIGVGVGGWLYFGAPKSAGQAQGTSVGLVPSFGGMSVKGRW